MSARERILDAAAGVMRRQGIAATTTREIAREAGCSEALLYKNFTDKQELFVAVLKERAPRLNSPDSLVGTRTVRENVETFVEWLLMFYVESFPIAASIFGSPSLLEAHRRSVDRIGAGPEYPALLVQNYLEAEIAEGRADRNTDTRALSRALTGAALFEAFQAVYAGRTSVEDPAGTARSIVAALGTGIPRG